jgi:hypothetical protein
VPKESIRPKPAPVVQKASVIEASAKLDAFAPKLPSHGLNIQDILNQKDREGQVLDENRIGISFSDRSVGKLPEIPKGDTLSPASSPPSRPPSQDSSIDQKLEELKKRKAQP